MPDTATSSLSTETLNYIHFIYNKPTLKSSFMEGMGKGKRNKNKKPQRQPRSSIQLC